jgi:hypothetical protein
MTAFFLRVRAAVEAEIPCSSISKRYSARRWSNATTRVANPTSTARMIRAIRLKDQKAARSRSPSAAVMIIMRTQTAATAIRSTADS